MVFFLLVRVPWERKPFLGTNYNACCQEIDVRSTFGVLDKSQHASANSANPLVSASYFMQLQRKRS